MKHLLTTLIIAAGAALISGCSGSEAASADVPQAYDDVCTALSTGNDGADISCRVIPELIEQFITDPDEKRGAYVITLARQYYQADADGWAEAWPVFSARFDVDDAYFDPETHGIARGQFNELLEAMYQRLGIDYGGDRKAFRAAIEEQLGSPEARAFIDERAKHYSAQR